MINPVTSGKLFGRPVAALTVSKQEQELIGAMDRARVKVVKLEDELKQFFDRGPRLSENTFDANDLKERLRGARENFANTQQRLSELRANNPSTTAPGAVRGEIDTASEANQIDVLFSFASSPRDNPLSTAEFQRSLEQYDARGKLSVLGSGSTFVVGQYVDKVY